MSQTAGEKVGRKRKSRVPVGEHLVLCELLRRGFVAQLTGSRHRILLVQVDDARPEPVRVKTVHGTPWYLRYSSFTKLDVDQVTIFVLLRLEHGTQSARFFVTRNRDLITMFHESSTEQAFAPIEAKALEQYEDRWDVLG
jgi:hypothetical protein